jgi:small subunit ribosomal protein S11e
MNPRRLLLIGGWFRWNYDAVQLARRLRPRKSGGTRTSVSVSKHLLKPLAALTLVSLLFLRDSGMGIDSSMSMILDKKCPFTGDVSIRGRILTGKVVSTKMTRTIIIRRDYLHYIPKYSESVQCTWRLQFINCDADRYEKRHKNLAAHVSPAFRVELGDTVTVGVYPICSVLREILRLIKC